MNSPIDILEQYKSGTISAQEAYNIIADEIGANFANMSVVRMWIEVSNKILDAEVSFKETDKDTDEAFWNSTHREE